MASMKLIADVETLRAEVQVLKAELAALELRMTEMERREAAPAPRRRVVEDRLKGRAHDR